MQEPIRWKPKITCSSLCSRQGKLVFLRFVVRPWKSSLLRIETPFVSVVKKKSLMKVMPAECVRHPSLRLPGISLKQKFDMQQVEFLESSRLLLLSFLKCLEESKNCKLFLLQSWTLCLTSGISLSTFPKTLTSKKQASPEGLHCGEGCRGQNH